MDRRTQNAEWRSKSELRRLVAVGLLNQDNYPSHVREAADVSWHVLEAWCCDDENMPLIPEELAEEVNNRAEFARQERSRVSERSQTRRGVAVSDDGDTAYRHKVEELTELKRRYQAENGERCVPYSQYSTDEIDELEGIVSAWFG